MRNTNILKSTTKTQIKNFKKELETKIKLRAIKVVEIAIDF